jgi:uncharacterized membrane protein
MEQQAVITQSIQPEYPFAKHRWMHHFFTEDISPDNHPIVELQRRASWLGLALIALSLSQIMNAPTIFQGIPFLFALTRCLAFVVLLLSFSLACMAFRPGDLKKQKQHLHSHPRLWQCITLISTLLVTTVGATLCVLTIIECLSPPSFSNDGTSLDTNAAQLLLQGRNPYTDSNMLDVAHKFQIEPDWTTPLRRGQFADRLEYPSFTEMESVLDTDLKTGDAPEFESRVSYPALSFLTLVPFVWLKDYNVLPLYFLSYLLLIVIAWKVTRPELRPWILLLAMANVPMWSSTYGGNLDIFYILLIVVAWLLRAHRWRSAIFLGLAIASKQIAWFFVPYYLIMIWRHYNLAESIRRLIIAGCLALIINLPFILWNPQAWLAGILAPIADPMFPLGLGFIELSINHVLPFFPSWVYDILEGIAILIALAWYWRLCRKHPEAAMLLAVFPLIFAWRSLPSYFFCAIFPAFILMAAKTYPRTSPVYRVRIPLSLNNPPKGEEAISSSPQRRESPIYRWKRSADSEASINPPRRSSIPVPMRATMQMLQLFHHVAPLRRFIRPGSIRPWFNLPSTWSENEDDKPAVQGG